MTFLETEHGRLRRSQRGIDKKDLKRALKYGTRENGRPRLNGDKTGKYTYKDIVYVVNETTGEEITCYALEVPLEPVEIGSTLAILHEKAAERAKHDLDSWTSNTVMVVDVSGSMKKADVWGARNRLQAVWLSIALDFVAHRVESGGAQSTDILSIVTLEDNPRVLLYEQPCTWVVYNQLV